MHHLFRIRHQCCRLSAALLTTFTLAVILPVITYAGATSTTIGSAERTIKNITDLLTGPIATAGFLLFIVVAGIAWWITRAQQAGKMLGRGMVGAVIIFGAAQITKVIGVTGAVL